jgi:hypothetical protein
MGHLYALCLESEAVCTTEEERKACLEKVTELASSLDEMTGQLERFLETGASRKKTGILDDRELTVVYNDLGEKLVAYDTLAIEIFEGFKNRLGEMEGVDQELVDWVGTLIENFDFDEALEALDRIFSE